MSALTATTDILQLLGEPTRVRLLALLGRGELTVADLVSVLDLAQSRISQHLGKLRDAGLLRDRREGTSTFYALSPDMPQGAREVWTLLERRLDDGILTSDRARADARLAARKHGRFDAFAGEMERHYSPGRTWESLGRALVPLLLLGDVLDAGAGDGTIAELVAGRARSITCLDASARMAAAAERRLARAPHARVLVGDVCDMPFSDASFDHVLLFNVLVFVGAPSRALSEVRRVLRRGGEVVAVTIAEHGDKALAREWGHVHTGFSAARLRTLLRRARLHVLSCSVTSRERREPHLSVVTAHARHS